MSKVKNYFWLKLNKDFFTQPQIKKLRRIAGGDTYTIIFQKILLLSISNGGIIQHQGIEPTIEAELALILDEDIENIKITWLFMCNSKLVELVDNNEYLIPSVVPLIGSETDAAERMRKMRAKKSVTLLPPVTKSYTEKEIELEIDTELEKDKKKNIHADIGVVFEHWQKVMDKPRAKLDNKRSGLIANCLKKYNLAELKQAIDGCSKSDFHMGKNPRCTKYNEISNIFRDNEKLEKFIELSTRPPPSLQGIINKCNSQNFSSEDF